MIPLAPSPSRIASTGTRSPCVFGRMLWEGTRRPRPRETSRPRCKRLRVVACWPREVARVSPDRPRDRLLLIVLGSSRGRRSAPHRTSVICRVSTRQSQHSAFRTDDFRDSSVLLWREPGTCCYRSRWWCATPVLNARLARLAALLTDRMEWYGVHTRPGTGAAADIERDAPWGGAECHRLRWGFNLPLSAPHRWQRVARLFRPSRVSTGSPFRLVSICGGRLRRSWVFRPVAFGCRAGWRRVMLLASQSHRRLL